MTEPLDSDLLHDPAVLAWKQLHVLIENGASDVDVDTAFRQYLEACEQQMRQKERLATGG